ncbi:fasciclin domain-containing protein [Nocardioides jishulii]|uniref:Fasciclin domain-containing protein n=1 Tax=Nocardioides jishulii TaxID=2575440 RepID=A0A4U2YRC1_9ACTN|nr:fasciclin domain-containing protein [Nocardioides jishulii]QCX26237.1 fasciclin domain-containing protein [Nocardioides jishulii]TKI63959.1 fasciclin domain-containing protein [Nocardioides jishulii]
MKLKNRSIGLAAIALTVSLGLAACGDDSSSSDNSSSDSSSSATPTPTPSPSPTEESMAAPAADAPFGPGCSAVPSKGPGSVKSMANQTVVKAASENPLLTTLASAIKAAGLVDTLNNAESLTVFAPTNEAFAAIPKKDLDALLADKKALTKVLTHHVVDQEIEVANLAGKHKTLNGDDVTVEGSGEEWTVDGAAVLCGNVDTANAKVYVIDAVLMP